MNLIEKYELLIREYVAQLPTVTTQSKLHQLNTSINCLKMVVRDLKASETETNCDVENVVGSNWNPTMMLRWREDDWSPQLGEFDKTLEQMWISDAGEEKWEEVPLA